MTLARVLFGFLLLLALPAGAAVPAAPAPAAAFFYGANPPTELLSQFDWAVVEPGQIGAPQLAALRAHGAQVFAYLSVGEAQDGEFAEARLDSALVRARNPDWRTPVLDLVAPAWHDYLLKRADQLAQQGYGGLFLDTLDSYRIFAKTDDEARRQQDALVALIGELHARHPDMKLLLNRGFELLDRVNRQIVGIAAESLYRGWNPGSKSYGEVSEEERTALLAELKLAHERYGLPVIVIDYLPAAEREQARATAAQIAKLGFVPWITTGDLDSMGVGLIEVMPRKVLLVYSNEDGDVAYSDAHSYAALPLEHLGYAADYQDAGLPPPSDELRGRYAGIVVWLTAAIPDPDAYTRWLRKQVADGVPIAIVNQFGLIGDGALLSDLGIKAVANLSTESFKVLKRDPMTGYEGFPEVPPISNDGFRATRADVVEHLLLEDGRQTPFATVLTAPWGGIAVAPWVIESVRDGQPDADPGEDAEKPRGHEWRERWILDPFAFFKTALHLPDMPAPDATTENGSRILTTHIDGDGFINRAELVGNPYAGQVILDRVLRRHALPTTVSVIEGELSLDGPNRNDALPAQAIARQIFKLPFVEIASHTYSHPYDWLSVREGDPNPNPDLAPSGYKFSMAREIDGSVQFIDRELAPSGKKTQMLLWSGDALPPEAALARTARLGLLNMNGGDTNRTLGDNSLLDVSPMTRPVGVYTQVYAPVTNENVYTNGYSTPLWGFDKAIQTFELTERPRRLKPITIYYHFFSASHGGSLAALERVYDYAERQVTLPMYESVYARTVLGFGSVGVARALDGSWRISGATDLRTLRLPASLGWPDLRASSGVAGVAQLPQDRYVALSGVERAVLRLTPGKGSGIALERANGRIIDWTRDGDSLRFRLRAEVPLKLELSGLTAGCAISAPGATINRSGERTTLRYRAQDSGDASIRCR